MPTTTRSPAPEPMYAVSIGHRLYERNIGMTRQQPGPPITLAEAWREVEGVAQARIWRITPDGGITVVLDNAGAMSVRCNVRRAIADQRAARRAAA